MPKLRVRSHHRPLGRAQLKPLAYASWPADANQRPRLHLRYGGDATYTHSYSFAVISAWMKSNGSISAFRTYTNYTTNTPQMQLLFAIWHLYSIILSTCPKSHAASGRLY